MNYSIHPASHLSTIELACADQERMLRFYREFVGLREIRRDEDGVHLGANRKQTLVILTPAKSPVVPSRFSSLYHFAFLVPTRYELARSLHHLLEMRYTLQGAFDHQITESIYVVDPEGNGVEIYADRPQSEWPYNNGQLQIAADELDLDFLLAELGTGKITWTGLSPKARIGHLHLQVPGLEEGKRFYHEILGFDLMLQDGGGTIYLSAGGYHQHIGLNTWQIASSPPTAGSPGLRSFTICLPEQQEIERLTERLKQYKVTYKQSASQLRFFDPFDIRIRVTLC